MAIMCSKIRLPNATENLASNARFSVTPIREKESEDTGKHNVFIVFD